MHHTLPLLPFGCLAWGFTGKDPHDPNMGTRLTVGVFVGHDATRCAYLLYHMDSNSIKDYAYINHDPHHFPILATQLLGERPTCLMDNDWRQHALYPLKRVSDLAAADFLAGKQIEFDLPLDWYPSYKHSWRARAHAPARSTLKGNTNLRGLTVIIGHYNGPPDTLSPADLQALSGAKPSFLTIPMRKRCKARHSAR